MIIDSNSRQEKSINYKKTLFPVKLKHTPDIAWLFWEALPWHVSWNHGRSRELVEGDETSPVIVPQKLQHRKQLLSLLLLFIKVFISAESIQSSEGPLCSTSVHVLYYSLISYQPPPSSSLHYNHHLCWTSCGHIVQTFSIWWLLVCHSGCSIPIRHY